MHTCTVLQIPSSPTARSAPSTLSALLQRRWHACTRRRRSLFSVISMRPRCPNAKSGATGMSALSSRNSRVNVTLAAAGASAHAARSSSGSSARAPEVQPATLRARRPCRGSMAARLLYAFSFTLYMAGRSTSDDCRGVGVWVPDARDDCNGSTVSHDNKDRFKDAVEERGSSADTAEAARVAAGRRTVPVTASMLAAAPMDGHQR